MTLTQVFFEAGFSYMPKSQKPVPTFILYNPVLGTQQSLGKAHVKGK